MHPLLLPVVVLLLVAYFESSSLRAFLGWFLLILFFLVVLPLVYVYLRSPRADSGAKRMQDPASFFRKNPADICILAIVCALPCLLLMIFLNAPSPLVATLVALLVTSLALALVNILYRASYHLAAITTLVIAALVVWGWVAFPVLVAIPIVGWALHVLRRHSLAQLATGFSLALVVSTVNFHLFGLLGNIAA